MTFWNAYILVIIVIYLITFFLRNLRTYLNVRKSIRGRSKKLTTSLFLSSIIYLLIFIQLFNPTFNKILIVIDSLQLDWVQYFGYFLIFVALIIGLAALFEMRNSWRVGIKHEQKTELVTTGIYSISRNPYFLSYDLLFLGIWLIFPSLILLVLVLILAVVFHFMILEEETYLAKVQGTPYKNYKSNVRRYL